MRNIRLTFAILLAALLLGGTAVQASPKKKKQDTEKGYRFTLFIAGTQDTVMYLGYYYAGATYAFDTARITPRGMFVFEDKETVLKPGLYFFTNPSGNYVEFAVYHEKLDFHFDTEEPGWQANMRVKGSEENELLFKFHQLNRSMFRTIDSASKSIVDSAAFLEFRARQMQILDNQKMDIINNNPDRLVSILMNATREPVVPVKDSLGNDLSMRERWNYLMDHYFDYTRLDDDAMIRTPDMIFHKRLTDYLDVNLKNAPAETIIEYVDKLIDRSMPAKENFRYLINTIANKYLQSNIMTYDAIYVHLVKRYIETGKCDWMSPTTIDENVKRANTWDNLLIGKPAPPLVMKDSQGQFHSLYNINSKYTLLIFWSPTCGHCKTVIPDLYKRYAKLKDKYGITAYAILSEPDDATRPKWHEFIEKNGLNWLNLDGGEANIDWHEVYDVITTPQIYLLDKDKKILAKKLGADSFEQIIEYLENQSK